MQREEKNKEVAEKVNKKKREGEGERNKVDSIPYPLETDQRKVGMSNERLKQGYQVGVPTFFAFDPASAGAIVKSETLKSDIA